MYRLLFSTMQPEMFEQNRGEVLQLLQDVGLNWETILDSKKKRMDFWFRKGSFGEDSLKRRNKLISTMALAAAAREAFERKRGLDEGQIKYMGIRQTLIEARLMYRGIFEEISDLFRPQALPSSVIFSRPKWSRESDWGIVEGMIAHTIYLLNLVKTRSYREAAERAISLMIRAKWNISSRNSQAVNEGGLFAWVKEILDQELEERKLIYKDDLVV